MTAITGPMMTVESLKKVKNNIIGNPLAKIQVVRDELFVSTLIDYLNALYPEPLTPQGKTVHDALRIEAAHVVASLAYGSEAALGILLRENTQHALLYAISRFTLEDSLTLRSAFSRTLRALSSSIADVVGPALWGLLPDKPSIKNEARQALEYLFQPKSLDIYLPLLLVSSNTSYSTPLLGVATSTAQMLSTTIRSSPHRKAVSEWLPPAERQREVKSRRGWEKTPLLAGSSVPWVAKQLVNLLGNSQQERDSKLVEACLSALAALANEYSPVASFLAKPFPDKDSPSPLANILSFTKSRNVDVQVAACLCISYTLRASPPLPPPSTHPHIHHSFNSSSSLGHAHPTSPSSSSSHASSSSTSPHVHSFVRNPAANVPLVEENCTRMVMNVVNRLLAMPLPLVNKPDDGNPGSAPDATVTSTSSFDSMSVAANTKTKACFLLHYLVKDDAALCHAAYDRGCLEHLGALIQSISPTEPTTLDWEENEPESIASLREAALTSLASIAMFSDDIRRRITDDLRLLPSISRALRVKRHVGTRYAACQCVRTMSRAVSVLRTSIVDSGLGMDVFRIVMGQDLSEKSSSTTGSNGSLGVVGGGIPGMSATSALGGRGSGKSNVKSRDGGKKREADADGMVVDSARGKAKGLGEDRRVIGAALSAVCNIVNDFSPLRPIYLEEKLMPRLVYILRESGDHPLRVFALWAVKNLVRKTSTETKRDIMSHLGWNELAEYLSDPEEEIKEQAFNALRNLAENEEGIAMVFRELGYDVLSKIAIGLQSSHGDVVHHSCSALANLANGTSEQQEAILHHPHLLSALQVCLAEGSLAVRKPAVWCIVTLVQAHPRKRKEMMDAGIVRTLRKLCDWASLGSGGGGGSGSGGHHNSGSGTGASSGSVAFSPPTPSWASRGPHSHARSPTGGASHSGVYGSWSGSVGGTIQQHLGGGQSPRYAHGTSSTLASVAHNLALEDDREVVQQAKTALEWLEHGESYIS